MVTLAIMEDFAARLLNESDSITVPMTVLRRRGVDLPELAALIAKYQLFPGKERRFAFENASPQRLLCEGLQVRRQNLKRWAEDPPDPS